MKVHKKMTFTRKFLADFLNYQYSKAVKEIRKPWSTTLEVEIMISLICIKIYKKQEYLGDYLVAFPYEERLDNELSKELVPKVEEFEEFITKYGSVHTLTDAILVRKLSDNTIRFISLQIKRFGLGDEWGGNTSTFINFLKKYAEKTLPNNNRLIIWREEVKQVRLQELVDWLNKNSYPFPEVLLLSQEKNLDVACYQLKPNDGTFATQLVSRGDIINV